MRKRFGRAAVPLLFILAVGAAALGLWAFSASGQTGLKGYFVNIVDELGNPITESTTLTIKNAGGDTQTVYSDAYGTAIGSTLTAGTSGEFRWWGSATSYSVTVALNVSAINLTKPGITPTTHLIVIPKVTMATVSPAQITLSAGKTVYGDPNGAATELVYGSELTTTGGTLALSNIGVAAGKMALANGKTYFGNTGGTAAAQTVSGCISFTNAGVASITDGTIADADIAANAAVTITKLALASGKIPVGGAGGAAAAQTITGVIAIDNAGVATLTAGTVTNTEVSATAGIVSTKLAVANGKIIVGGAGGAGADQTVSGDATMSNSAVVTLNAAHANDLNLVAVEDPSAAQAIVARPIFVHPGAVTLTSVGILTQGTPAGVDDSNTSVITVKDDAGNTIVAKTYNTGTQPPTSDYADLGALDGTHKVLTAGEHITLTVANGSTANLPAFVIVLYYSPTNQ